MKIVRFETDNGKAAPGIVEGDTVVSLETICSSFQRLFGMMHENKKVLEEECLKATRFPLNAVKLKAPLDQTATVYAVAANYKKHAAELGVSIPRHPIIFNKLCQSMIGPGEDVILPPYSKQVDYEGELAVIIGRRGFAVTQKEAMDYVGGYTCFNDITARDKQWTELGDNRIMDWFSSKMMQSSTPLGPWIVSWDEISEPHALRLQTRVNGNTVQDESTARMVFQIPSLIEYISSRVVLYPGDIIATGTPFGVGGYEKKVILQHDDTVEVEIDQIGILTNRCRR